MRTAFQGCRWLTSHCTLLWWRGRQRGGKFSCDSNSIQEGFILRASSNPNYLLITITLGLPRWHSSKESACQCRRHKRLSFSPCVGKIPWSRKWQLTLVLLPGKFHGHRSLVGYSPWSHKRVEHDWARWTHEHVAVAYRCKVYILHKSIGISLHCCLAKQMPKWMFLFLICTKMR